MNIPDIKVKIAHVMVYTMRDKQGEDVIRIISARKATAAERRKYEVGKRF